MNKSLLFFVLIGAILCSCHNTPIVEPAAPEITLVPPSDSIFFSGDTLHIIGDLSDEDELHEAFICVRDTGDTMFAFDPYVHELPSYHVDTFWVVSGTGPANLSFEAENHHDKITVIDLPFLRF
jgi:hypothetical protein